MLVTNLTSYSSTLLHSSTRVSSIFSFHPWVLKSVSYGERSLLFSFSYSISPYKVYLNSLNFSTLEKRAIEACMSLLLFRNFRLWLKPLRAIANIIIIIIPFFHDFRIYGRGRCRCFLWDLVQLIILIMLLNKYKYSLNRGLNIQTELKKKGT